MTNQQVVNTMLTERKRPKFGTLMHSDINILNNQENDIEYYEHHRVSTSSVPTPPSYETTPTASPYTFSPWNQPISPFINSPWIQPPPSRTKSADSNQTGLIGSLVRQEGHIYSLAASGDFLYTGSDSKNIHVWKNLKEFSGFKSSNSGLVKAIVVLGNKIFTGHQDGKIRVWRFLPREKKVYKRIGNLPSTRDYIKCSMNTKNYVQVRRHKSVPWVKHFDAVSCMCLDEKEGILYSGSWDKTLKVWRLSDYKCMESVNAHDDAVNSVVASYGGLVFSGSADGTVKVWRKELVGKLTRHVLVQTLLKQENAVTAVAVAAAGGVVYGGASDGVVSYWLRVEQSLAYGGALRGHKMAVLCLAVAGRLVVSGSADKSICVWRREESGDHGCLTVLTGHAGPVKCLAIEGEDHDADSRDDEEGKNRRWRLYSGSLDKSVKVWRVYHENPPEFHRR